MENRFNTLVATFEDKKIEDKVPFEFIWEGDPNDIHFYKPSCGCTDVGYDDDTKKIYGTLDLSRVGAVEGEKKIVTKYIRVALNPDVPENIVMNKKWGPNPAKEYINLSITGTMYMPIDEDIE